MKLNKNKIVIIIILLVVIIIFAFAIDQIIILRKAHSTFENYYSFRGCVQLTEKTNDYGLCKTTSGQVVKIVKSQGKWYLDGDLPCGFLCF